MTSAAMTPRGEPQLDLARLSQAWALAPIFRPLARAKERGYLDVTMRVGELEIKVVGRWALGIDDQDVLLALLRLAEHRDRCPQIGPVPTTDAGKEARVGLKADGRARAQNTVAVQTTLRELARTAGHQEDGGSLDRISESLQHLGQATVILDAGGLRWTQAHIVSHTTVDDGRVLVALHPHLAQALLGGREAVTRLDMQAYRSLRGEVARRLYVRLCGYLDPGRERRARVDTLAAGVWPDPPGSPAVLRWRRRACRLALAEIGGLVGWTIRVEGAGADTVAVMSRAGRGRADTPPRRRRKGRRSR